ncbi:MAG: RagB/SusD family nutrient uptake outer membrane protein [Gemmatimonadetes bacterium]|nr:RagB/SusD family nutrient uptake outer membrane protein [Gemmatimonadota bacterium]
MTTKLISAVVLAAALAASTGCGDFEIPNADNPNLNALEDNPSPSVLISATQGLLQGIRTGTTTNLSTFAHYGREGYYIDVAQTTLSAFDVVLTPGTGGGGGWNNTYQYVRLGNTILTGLDKVGSAMTDQQKEGIRGFVKTAGAYLLHGQLRAMDAFGVVIATDNISSTQLPAVASKTAAFAFINQRLDEGRVHLLAAGAAFAFSLGTGFAGFSTPATFIQVNRALRSRVAIEANDYAGAVAALGASFVNPASAMDLGPKNIYSTATGDAVNGFFDPNGFSYVADSMLPVEAQLRLGATKDLRVTSKMTRILGPGGVFQTRKHTGVESGFRWTLYSTSSSPIPIIKNEELLLIRAEARWRTGDQPGALADINAVRTVSGGLPALGAIASDAAFDNELLYNRRYSLLLEYGHRWVDLRRFNRLTDLKGPRGAGDLVFDKVPLPQSECDQRPDPKPTGCSQVSGFRTTS